MIYLPTGTLFYFMTKFMFKYNFEKKLQFLKYRLGVN